MAKRKEPVQEPTRRRIRPALTPEARELQIANLAMDLAEQQILDGTASSQVITHFLKAVSSKERQEAEMREMEKQLLAARTEALQAQKRSEELFKDAIEAFKRYSGNGGEEDDEYEY